MSHLTSSLRMVSYFNPYPLENSPLPIGQLQPSQRISRNLDEVITILIILVIILNKEII